MKQFIVVEPDSQLCELMLRNLTKAVAEKGKTFGIESLDRAVVRVAGQRDVAMVFVAYDSSSPKGAATASVIKDMMPNTKVILTSNDPRDEAVSKIWGLDGFIPKGNFVPVEHLRCFLLDQRMEV